MTPQPPEDRAVFWYGCNMTRHGQLIRTAARLLEAVGIAAASAGGPGHCCGTPKEADARIAGGMAERTVEAFNARAVPEVVTWCPSCHMNMADFMAPVTAPAFNTRHISEVLHARLDRLRPLLTHAVPARALLHTHAGFDGRVPVNTMIPEMLRAIPGLTLVEPAPHSPGHMCSALAGVPGALGAAQAGTLDAAERAGCDMIVTIFHSCHREFVELEKSHGIRVVNWVHLLAQAIGWPCHDGYKDWRNADDPRAAVGFDRVAAAGEVAFARLTEPELRRPSTLKPNAALLSSAER